eukprot:SAG31_NODE_6598_length_1957_cov_1.244349_1_plen_230_part_10
MELGLNVMQRKALAPKIRSWLERRRALPLPLEATDEECDAAEERRRALRLPLGATDEECDAAEELKALMEDYAAIEGFDHPPLNDLAAHLYAALACGPKAAEAVVTSKMAQDPLAWSRPSQWAEKRWRPLTDSGDAKDRVFIDDCGKEVADAASAGNATDGLSALNILARDCTDATVMRASLEVVANHIDIFAIEDSHGSLPMHYAAQQNSSAEVVGLLLEAGGKGQLEA